MPFSFLRLYYLGENPRFAVEPAHKFLSLRLTYYESKIRTPILYKVGGIFAKKIKEEWGRISTFDISSFSF